MTAQEAVGQALLDGFLARRDGNTRYAYRHDLSDFARHMNLTIAAAVLRLLGSGPVASRRLVLDYAVELQRLGRAPRTIDRRLGTLRALAREAMEEGLVSWMLSLPREEEILAEVEERRNSASYLLPRHASEIDRLDVQHYALREALGGNYTAPIEDPRWILDTGCGTGQWGYEMCELFPGAQVVGLDLVSGKPGHPRHYRFVRGNILDGLPFQDGAFDFVHQRFLVAGVPLNRWSDVAADLVRVTRPGGWVELVEARLMIEPAGPATRLLSEMGLEMAAKLGLETGRIVADSLDGYLRHAGLRGVTKREFALPCGEWGGYVGTLMAADMRAGFTRVCEVLHSISRYPLDDGIELVRRMAAEFEELHSTITCATAVGSKPA